MFVKEVMNRNVRIIRSDSSVQEAAIEMDKYRIGCLVVISGSGMTKGIVTERDILKKVVAKAKESGKIKVEEIMTKEEDLILIEANASLEDAVDTMVRYGIKKLPVVEEGQLAGIITVSDLIRVDHALIGKAAQLLVYPKRKK